MAPPKRPWLRWYTEAIYDPKLRRLPPAQRWLWVVVLSMARQSPVPGLLLLTVEKPVTDADLVDASGLTEEDIRQGLDAMAGLGLITVDQGTRAWQVARWDERQFDSDDGNARKARSRERQYDADATAIGRRKDGDRASDATSPESESESESETLTSESYLRPVPTEQAFGGGGGGGDVIGEAARLLAEAEAARRGTDIANPAGYVRSRIPAIRNDNEAAWRAILDRHPASTAAQLVNGQRPVPEQEAQTAIRDLATKRREAPCPDCHGARWLEDPDDPTSVLDCPTCQATGVAP